ncbi:glycosyl hydrolase family 28-related protein [Asticcacaulis sp. SL142]|uniref:glycosyl hydrolase family 28-related protein n=1 Tax=Asticcacaulis sp. SL142 TaxID=2995155 RepID=UPI00226C8869|nr:glycosyl hydrolase family 28-related protein [Asticcacaulis sp. SL142]WAC48295.1 glycosyl hydrolase family 28-related protein [Asticcacaulis sp. SL142]
MSDAPSRRETLHRLCATVLASGMMGAGYTQAHGANSQPFERSAVLPSLKGLADYSYAGYGFGLEAIPSDSGTLINVADFGAKGDGQTDDSRAVREAIAAAHKVAGKVTVRFPKGRFVLTEVMRIERSDFVLEGAGRGDDGTTLYFPRPLRLVDESQSLKELREYIRKENKRQIEKDRNVDYWFSEYSWSEGFIRVGIPGTRYAEYLPDYDTAPDIVTTGASGAKWTRHLEVKDARAIKAGQILQIQWFSDKGRDSAIIRSLYGETDLPIGQRHYDNPARALVTQTTRILSVRGNRIELGDPLLHAVSAEQPARIVRKAFLTDVGIQGLLIEFPDAPAFGHHLEEGYNALALHEMFDGWVRDVTIHNADSGVLTYDSASLTLTDIATTGEREAHYSVHVGNAHNVLVRNLMVANTVIHPLSVNTQATRAVYSRAVVLRGGLIDQHAGANHENLFDAVRLHIQPRLVDGVWVHDTWAGGGAPYWQPNHGLHNTTWNLEIVIEGGAPWNATVELRGLKQGVGENIIGVYGNRRLTVTYPRAARIEGVNSSYEAAPSLYDYQTSKRKRLT